MLVRVTLMFLQISLSRYVRVTMIMLKVMVGLCFVMLIYWSRCHCLKSRLDYSDSAATSTVLRLIGIFSIFTPTHCISHWSQQNRCSLNKPRYFKKRYHI